MTQKQETSLKELLTQFIPLSLSDVAMTLGDPLQTAALSRLNYPQETLAAVGVVKAIAVFLESPIIMILHAATALGIHPISRRTLWKFTFILGLTLSSIFFILTFDPLYNWLMTKLFAVSDIIAQRSRYPFILMILWPFIIAWRRFFQGLLIRGKQSNLVGFASIIRFSWVIAALTTGVINQFDGAILAAITMMGAILIEAIMVTSFARQKDINSILDKQPLSTSEKNPPETLTDISIYYFPLASTMLIIWGAKAILLTLVARSFDGSLALAVWPAAWGLVLSIANGTRMVQQVVISSYDKTSHRTLITFVILVGIIFTSIPFFLAFTDLGFLLLKQFLGNNPTLVNAARPVLQILSVLPFLLALQNSFQGLLIHQRKNWYINLATLTGATITLIVSGTLIFTRFSGATSAAYAMIIGLISEIIILLFFLKPLIK